jgi:hypothetical protein
MGCSFHQLRNVAQRMVGVGREANEAIVQCHGGGGLVGMDGVMLI